MYRIITSHSNAEQIALDTGYLMGVPGIIYLGNLSGLVAGGECGGNSFLEGMTRSIL